MKISDVDSENQLEGGKEEQESLSETLKRESEIAKELEKE